MAGAARLANTGAAWTVWIANGSRLGVTTLSQMDEVRSRAVIAYLRACLMKSIWEVVGVSG
jgi:hypothetical protein